ncbi:hypothetical protein [Rhizobium laguerreae]|uniref:hypothetical protein n=1 Tax=Rhizobium laguerreae TaxID=1076926 RepID=UPI001C91CDBE|nr:hypothetical protein [Rhizobium laguerreae]MBY3201319.1 hypothetical protein [Rhizobium laguerreae]
MIGNNKGAEFESRVGEILETLERIHPGSVRVFTKPLYKLREDEEIIPDFELHFDLLFEEARYIIECQNREKTDSALAHKIRHIKALTRKNRFIFVYGGSPTEWNLAAYKNDGILTMSIAEFSLFVGRISIQLHRSGHPDEVSVEDFDLELARFLEDDVSPSDYERKIS